MVSKNFANDFITDVKPYTLSSHTAWEHESHSVLKLDWNESTLPPSPLVYTRLLAAIEAKPLSWYPDTNNQKLREKIAQYAGVSLLNVQYYPSSDNAHEVIARVFSAPKRSVLIISPTYDNFRVVVEMTGAEVERYTANNKFEVNIDQLNQHIASSTHLIVYLANPNNPTGTIIYPDGLEKLVKSNQDKIFVIDEAYYEFNGITIAPRISEFENLIITRTFSKAFGLASFRIGYIIAPTALIQVMDKVRNAKNIPLLSQVAAEAALDDAAYMKDYVSQVEIGKESFKSKLSELKIRYFCGGGNFILMKIEDGKIDDFITYLQEHRIYVRSYAHAPNMEGYVRITVGTKEQMQSVSKVMENFFNGK